LENINYFKRYSLIEDFLRDEGRWTRDDGRGRVDEGRWTMDESANYYEKLRG
jgi:hypothetical protein